MTDYADARAGYAVRDIAEAMAFYGQVLGLDVAKMPLGKTDEVPSGVEIRLHGRLVTSLYPKPDHQPAGFTVLSLLVSDIDKAVDDLSASGVTFEHRSVEPKTDEKGVHRHPLVQPVAWFRDPSGNFLALIEA